MGCICGKSVSRPIKHNAPIKTRKPTHASENSSKQISVQKPSDTSHESVASIPPPKYENPKIEKVQKIEIPLLAPPPPPKKQNTLSVGSIPLPDLVFYEFSMDSKLGDFERSHLNDWQSLLKQHCNFSFANLYSAITSSNTDNYAIKTS